MAMVVTDWISWELGAPEGLAANVPADHPPQTRAGEPCACRSDSWTRHATAAVSCLSTVDASGSARRRTALLELAREGLRVVRPDVPAVAHEEGRRAARAAGLRAGHVLADALGVDAVGQLAGEAL